MRDSFYLLKSLGNYDTFFCSVFSLILISAWAGVSYTEFDYNNILDNYSGKSDDIHVHVHVSDVVIVICNCNQLHLITFEK